jgi:hypothetical protein
MDMSFCCGASMIGTRGTLKHDQTLIHNVPLLFCPVCHRTKVHFLVENEFEILAEFASSDGAREVDFADYVDMSSQEWLYENCVNSTELEDPQDVMRTQIDMALDLLSIARQIGDVIWQEQLKKRLRVLSERRSRMKHSGRNTSIV